MKNATRFLILTGIAASFFLGNAKAAKRKKVPKKPFFNVKLENENKVNPVGNDEAIFKKITTFLPLNELLATLKTINHDYSDAIGKPEKGHYILTVPFLFPMKEAEYFESKFHKIVTTCRSLESLTIISHALVPEFDDPLDYLKYNYNENIIFKELTTLHVENFHIDKNTFTNITKTCPALKGLTLKNCTFFYMDKDTFKKFIKSHPLLTEFTLENCKFPSKPIPPSSLRDKKALFHPVGTLFYDIAN